MNNGPDNRSLYVVTCRNEGSDARAMAVASLGKAFDQCRFVHPTRESGSENPWAVRPWRNPLQLLELLGLAKLSHWLGRWVFFPSPDVLFTHAVLPRLFDSIQRDIMGGLDVSVLLTAPPHASVTMVNQIKQRAPSVRVIVDWQDLWSYDESYFRRAPEPYRKHLLMMEQRAMDEADLNVTTNERARDLLVERHHLAPDKVVAIHHHFISLGESRNKPDPSSNDTCRVGFLGNLFKPPKVRGDKIFALFDRLARQKKISLELIGDTTGKAGNEPGKLTHPCVRFHDRLPTDEAVSKLASMDLLLLTLEDLPNCKIIMHGKLPAYLAAGVPIVALVPNDSFVADLIRETGVGFVLSNPDRWEEDFGTIIDRSLAGTLSFCPNPRAVGRYSWQYLQGLWMDAIVNTDEAGTYHEQ